MKECIKCKLEKPDTEYHKNLKNKNGIQSVCKICRKQMDRIRLKTSNKSLINKKRKDKLRQEINDLKSQLGCSTCTENDYRCLDFHHVDPKTKSSTIANLKYKGCSMKAILHEIEKCIVLCANCHRKLHVK